jgi:hypothetical protein
MKSITALALLLALCQCAPAQFFYKDILSTLEPGVKQQVFKATHVLKVTVHNFNPDGTENKDFVCEQTLGPTYHTLETLTSSQATGKSFLTSTFDDSSRLIRSLDSDANAITTTVYAYGPSGNLTSIHVESRANNDTVRYISSEVHLWQYNAAGHPFYMVKIKDGTDTTFVQLKTDDQGNVTDELSYRQGSPLEHYYYYYDDAHHLTDIVRYNTQKQRMMPDYMFEYDGDGRLAQTTTVQVLDNDYLIWRYEYDSNGLRTKELCYDKSKEPQGSIQYEYQR